MIERDVVYSCGDVKLTGYFTAEERGLQRPGVLVCHQGGGLTEHARERARMLTEIGLSAFALDLYGKVATRMEEAMPLMLPLVQNPAELRKRAQAGLDAMKAQPEVDVARLAAIGFCFGGAVALELARFARELSCVIAFHPAMAPPVPLPESDERKIECRVLVCAGADDPLIPPAAREKFAELMTAAGADWRLILYDGVGHSFTDKSVDALNIPNFRYDEAADGDSWVAMKGVMRHALA